MSLSIPALNAECTLLTKTCAELTALLPSDNILKHKYTKTVHIKKMKQTGWNKVIRCE